MKSKTYFFLFTPIWMNRIALFHIMAVIFIFGFCFGMGVSTAWGEEYMVFYPKDTPNYEYSYGHEPFTVKCEPLIFDSIDDVVTFLNKAGWPPYTVKVYKVERIILETKRIEEIKQIPISKYQWSKE